MSRFVCSLLVFVVSLATLGGVQAMVPSLDLYTDEVNSPFELGVASGDPLPSSILLWTRAQKNGDESTQLLGDQSLTWRIWKANDVTSEINGTVLAQASRDLTVTVDVTGLEPDTVYNFQFIHDVSGNQSAIGRTRTAPLPTAEVPIKVVTTSCSSIWSGYMNSYGRIAEMNDVNVVVHLGDFIYPELDRSSCERVPPGLDPSCRNECLGKEMPQTQAANISALVQRHNCSVEPVEYFRWVYQYYLHDPLLRSLRQQHPIVAIFDNHDVGSSRSVNLTRDGGLQAFLEYVPARARISALDNSTVQFFRELRFGKLVDLIALDTRAIGFRVSGDGTYLGESQRAWVSETLANASDVQWRLVLTTVAFAPWAVNGWDIYVNSVFGGVLAALCILAVGCISATVLHRRRVRRRLSAIKADNEKGMEEGLEVAEIAPLPSVKERRKQKALLCCAVYGGCSVMILIGAWVAATLVVNRVIAARRLSVSSVGNSLALVAGQERNWDGHPDDRRDFLQRMRDANTTMNNVWISGDLHMSLAADVRDIDHTDASSVHTAERFGVEMLSSSVSRANVDEIVASYVPRTFVPAAVNVVQTIMYRANPHFRYYEVTEHGYGVLLFSQSNVTGQYWHTPVLEKTSEQWLAKKVVCPLNSNRWIDQ